MKSRRYFIAFGWEQPNSSSMNGGYGEYHEAMVAVAARNDDGARKKLDKWKKENAGVYKFVWGPFLYKKLSQVS